MTLTATLGSTGTRSASVPSASFGDSDARPHTAILTVHGVTIEEGTAEARVPITISSQYPEQTLHGIVITPTIEGGMQIKNNADMARESLFNGHPQSYLYMLQQPGASVRSYVQGVWGLASDLPCKGVVLLFVLDTSKLKVGEYWIRTDGYTSATDSLDNIPATLHTVDLHHEPATVKVVAKKQ